MPHLDVLQSKRLYEGKVFHLVVDEVRYASGTLGTREVAEHPGGAVTVPLLANGDVLLIRQFRYPIKKHLYELPAGKLDPSEDPPACAARELEEETGFIAGSLRKLAAIYTSPGFCTEQLHIFLATDLIRSEKGQRLEEGELGLTVESMPLKRAVEMIEEGEIVDGKTICGILLAERSLSREEHHSD
ncbi:MAG TPA: NUDIX hydrolase [Bacteroidetes bacterium]|nr:NUDIX hydrolase [Bacteroidota bacterium]